MKFNLDISQIVNDMVQASGKSLLQDVGQTIEYGTNEYEQFILHLQNIQDMAEDGSISDDEAQDLVDEDKLSMQAVAETEKGLAKIAAQNAINAAIDVLNNALKAALGTAFKSLKFTL